MTPRLLLAAALAIVAGQARADCDAAVLTAVDSSTSVDQRELRVQVQGMAYAIQSPELLQTIQRTESGCVLFGVYLWADHKPVIVLDWTVIGSEEQAKAAAGALEAAVNGLGDNPAGIATDTSSALTFAYQMFATPPVMTGRQVLNLITDDTPNTNSQFTTQARDALLAAGAQINGVLVGDDVKVLAFLRSQVIGGRGAFTMQIAEVENMASALISKFRLDLARAE